MNLSISSANRREFLHHWAAIGLGAAIVPSLGNVVRADQTKRATQPPAGVVLEKIESGGLSHYSYFLADKASGVAAVIDPRRDVDVYLELAKQHGVKITLAIETHIHADFVSGARELAERTGSAKIAASVEGDVDYGFKVDRKLTDGDELRLGETTLKAIHTPGHTPEHMTYLASTNGSQPWGLFTGDFLFIGSVGRPDLMGVENTDSLAKALYRSVRNALTDLAGELMIYPAHGPGSPCGAGIKSPEGDPTLGQERRSNPYWQMSDQAEFINLLLDAQPPVPYYWPRMKEINAAGPTVLGDRPNPKMMKPDEFGKFIQGDDVQLLDTRLMHAYAGGHISGAFCLGYNEVMSMWGGWTLDPDKPIALIKPARGNFKDPMNWLARVGLTNVEAALDGDMGAWVKGGHDFDSFRTMSVHEVQRTFPTDKMTLLDVRQPSEWDMGHLPGAKFMFLPEIPERMGELDKSKPVIVYCGNGYRATLGTSLLRQGGFDARSVPGSWDAWVAAGYPAVTPESPGKASDTRRSA